jgi:glutaredoxin
MKKDERKPKQEKETAATGVNLWMISTAVLGIAFLVVLVLFLQSGGSTTPSSTISAETCGAQMINFINKNYPGMNAIFKNAVETNGIFEIDMEYQNEIIPLYATKDCKLLFPNSIDVTNVTPIPTTTTTPVPTPVKAAVPTVDLYVMSFCPYGVQAENTLKPVVDLLGTKANFTVRYIASVNGNTINNVSSLHGLNEAKEDARQLCILQHYPDKFWSYLMQINGQCYPQAGNSTALEACWKNVATRLSIDVSEVESCAYGSEGINLLRASKAKVDQYGVSGSPTLFINGQKYTGTRSAEAFKVVICNAFQTVPSECSMNLSSDVTSVSGSC